MIPVPDIRAYPWPPPTAARALLTTAWQSRVIALAPAHVTLGHGLSEGRE
jgi:hypothetical protein